MISSSKTAQALLLAALLASVAAPAMAEEGGPPPCPPDAESCNPPPPPSPLPDLPAPVATTGYYWLNQDGFQPVDGHINNGQVQVVYGAATRSYGDSALGATLTTTLVPVASATAESHSTRSLSEGMEGAVALGYTVVVHAANQAAADALTALLGSDGSILGVHGNYTIAQTGGGVASIHVRTSAALAGSPAHTLNIGCDGGGLACGMGTFDLAVNLSSATGFLGGDPLDFIGEISIEADAFAGHTHYSGGLGTAYAFIDPLFTLNPALGSAYSLSIGGGMVANGTPGGAGAVPEPATWALMLGGFGLAGSALRRRRGGRVPA